MNPILRSYRFLFARPRFRRLNAALHSLALHGLGVLNFENEEVSGERFLIQRYLPAKIRNPRPVFFDVGANVGNLTASLLGKFPDALIYAFEPHPRNFLRLSNAGFAPGRVALNNLALGSAPGRMTLYDRADYEGSEHASLYAEVISDIHGKDVTEVEVLVSTLDNVTAENNIARIDYLKIDTEGNELAVLIGAARMLKERRIGHIHFEFNEMNVVSRVFMRDFRKLLPDYEFFRLLPRGLLPLGAGVLASEIFGFQNILAVPADAGAAPHNRP
jgi:FkbM family methyltransferase